MTYIKLTQHQADFITSESLNFDFGNKNFNPIPYTDYFVIPESLLVHPSFSAFKDHLEDGGHLSQVEIVTITDAQWESFWSNDGSLL